MGEAILLETGIATVIAVLGGVLAVGAAGGPPEAHRRRVGELVSLAAGVLLAVTLASVLPEAAETLSWPGVALATASGYLLFYLIGRYVYPVCPACAVHAHAHDAPHDDSCDHGHHTAAPDLRRTATLLGFMVALHAATDGIALATGSGIAAEHHAANLNSLPLLAAVSLHKLPEGLALTALLLGGGFRRAPALALSAGIESATLLGGALGMTLITSVPLTVLGAIMAHSGGGFLYLVGQALAGKPAGSDAPRPSHQLRYGGLGFAAAALLLLGLHLLPGHS